MTSIGIHYLFKILAYKLNISLYYCQYYNLINLNLNFVLHIAIGIHIFIEIQLFPYLKIKYIFIYKACYDQLYTNMNNSTEMYYNGFGTSTD